MANITIDKNDVGKILLEEGVFQNELLTLAGAGTIKPGTILARDTGTLKLVKFVKGGSTAGNGVPCCVTLHEVVAAGAADFPVRVVMRGKVAKKRLVIDADGNDTNIDAAVRDQLRDFGIVTEDLKQLDAYDNG